MKSKFTFKIKNTPKVWTPRDGGKSGPVGVFLRFVVNNFKKRYK